MLSRSGGWPPSSVSALLSSVRGQLGLASVCEAKPPERTTVRVVATWRPLGAISGGQTHPQALASAFQGRLADVQGR